MIDEKKLIEDLLHNDGMDFTVNVDISSAQSVCNACQEFVDKMKEGFVNLINAQQKVGGGWIRTADALPDKFVSVLMYTPIDAPFPAVHEGYWTDGGVWISIYGEAYTLGKVPFWMPMPEPPKDGEGQ